MRRLHDQRFFWLKVSSDPTLCFRYLAPTIAILLFFEDKRKKSVPGIPGMLRQGGHKRPRKPDPVPNGRCCMHPILTGCRSFFGHETEAVRNPHCTFRCGPADPQRYRLLQGDRGLCRPSAMGVTMMASPASKVCGPLSPIAPRMAEDRPMQMKHVIFS